MRGLWEEVVLSGGWRRINELRKDTEVTADMAKSQRKRQQIALSNRQGTVTKVNSWVSWGNVVTPLCLCLWRALPVKHRCRKIRSTISSTQQSHSLTVACRVQNEAEQRYVIGTGALGYFQVHHMWVQFSDSRFGYPSPKFPLKNRFCKNQVKMFKWRQNSWKWNILAFLQGF